MSGDWLADVRNLELQRLRRFLPAGGRLLDFGAGAGYQALALQKLGFCVEAVDVPSSTYADGAVFPIAIYDGRTLPFPDARFDVVVSSNVLEHVADLDVALSELSRVCKPGAIMLHVMPSASWRVWTTLAEFVAAPRNAARSIRGPRDRDRPRRGRGGRWLLPLAWLARPLVFRPHGVHGCALTELWTFTRAAWVRRFARHGYEVQQVERLRLWYTGEVLLGQRLSPSRRTQIAGWLGSATTLYVVHAGLLRRRA